MIKKLKENIKDLGKKLLYEATKEIKPEIAVGEFGKKSDIAQQEQRKKVRSMKNRLRELIGLFHIIQESALITVAGISKDEDILQ